MNSYISKTTRKNSFHMKSKKGMIIIEKRGEFNFMNLILDNKTDSYIYYCYHYLTLYVDNRIVGPIEIKTDFNDPNIKVKVFHYEN